MPGLGELKAVEEEQKLDLRTSRRLGIHSPSHPWFALHATPQSILALGGENA